MWVGVGQAGRVLDTVVGSSLGFVAHIAICMLRIVSSSSRSATASVAGEARLAGISVPSREGWSGVGGLCCGFIRREVRSWCVSAVGEGHGGMLCGGGSRGACCVDSAHL